MGNETDDIIDELIKSFLQRYQKSLEKSMKKGSDFIFNSVDLLCYHLHKISLKRGGSYIDSPKWLKNKGATINPKNEEDECFKYALTVVLNHQNIGKNPQRRSKIKPFIDQYKWKGIDFSSHSKHWKKFEQNNKTIALNILLIPYNTEEIRLLYKSKYNNKCNNKVILLMITDGKKWHYLAVKSFSALFRGITSNNHGDCYCLNCLHFSEQKKNSKNIKRYAIIMIIVI